MSNVSFAQQPVSTFSGRKISKIKSEVKSINNARLNAVSYQKVLKGTTGYNERVSIPFNETYIVMRDADKKIKKVSVYGPGKMFEGRGLTEFYFVNDSILCVHKKYIIASRMGSCGAIPFEYYLFYQHNVRAGFENCMKLQNNFYDSCYPLRANDAEILGELKSVLEFVSRHYGT